MEKKLYKNKKGAKISGVCQGLSEYFEIDVTVIRVLFLILVFITGIFPCVILYFAAALVMPDKEDIGYDDYDVE